MAIKEYTRKTSVKADFLPQPEQVILPILPPQPVTPEQDLSEKLLEFIYMYLTMVPNPTQEQLVGLADAIGCKPTEFQELMVSILGDRIDDEVLNTLRDADLKGNPGINVPGDLDSFKYNDVNPFGRTDLTKIESPFSMKIPEQLLSSSSKGSSVKADFSDNFLAPLETLETAELAPANSDTGIDDGALVNLRQDEDEQKDLIDDGAYERVGEIEQLNDTPLINDGSI